MKLLNNNKHNEFKMYIKVDLILVRNFQSCFVVQGTNPSVPPITRCTFRMMRINIQIILIEEYIDQVFFFFRESKLKKTCQSVYGIKAYFKVKCIVNHAYTSVKITKQSGEK